MRKIKRVLLLAFVLSVLLGCLMLHASAAEVVASGYCGGEGDGTNLSWTLDSEGTLTITGSGAMENTVDYGIGLFSTSTDVWSWCESIKTLVIEEGVTTIGDCMFSGCEKLTSLSISNTVTSIGWGSFYNCIGLTTVTIPASVTEIEDWAFSGTSLCNVYFEGDAPEILVTGDEDSSFPFGAIFYYPIGENGWTNGEAYDAATGTWNGYKLEVWKEKAYVAYGYCGREGNGTDLQWTLDKEGTLTITGTGPMSNYAYTDMPWYGHINSIKKVVVENGVTTIGSSAFIDYYGLTSVTIPASVTAIGTGAFYRDDRWDTVNPLEVYFEGNAPTIGEITEDGTYGVTKVFCPDDVLYYIPGTAGWTDSEAYDAATGAWNGYKLAVWKEKAYVAYGYCGGEGDGTNLSWTLDSEGTLTVTGTGKMADYGYDLKRPWASYSNTIKKIVIGEGVNTIGYCSFNELYKLSAVTIPSSVTEICLNAFYHSDCWGGPTVRVYFEGDAPYIHESDGSGYDPEGVFCSNDILYYIPGTSGWMDSEAYNAANGRWNGCKLAVWAEKASPYTVTFDSNGGGTVAAQTVKYGDLAIEPAAPTKDGYNFEYWCLNGVKYDFASPITGDIHLTAQFRKRPSATLSAIEVSMDSELLLWLKFNLPEELVNDDKAYAVVTADKKGGLKETVIPMTEIRAKGADKNGRYVIEQGMASPELGREVTVSFVDGNGNDVNITDYMDGSVNTSVTRTIVDYAKLALEKGNTKQKNLNRALLAYGGYAQTFFKVDTAAPVYNVLPAFGYEIPTFAEITADTLTQVMTNTGDAGITVNTQQAFLDSSIYHRVYFTVNRGTSIDELDFRLTKYGNPAVTTEVEPVYEANADRYYIQIDDIASPLLDYMYTITVTNGTTFEDQTVSTSVMCWLKLGLQKSNNAAQKNLFKAMYNYNQVANSFFGR